MIAQLWRRWRPDPAHKRRVRGALLPLGARARGAPLLAGAVEPLTGEHYPVIDGPHYIDALGALHLRRKPSWYLEVGSFKGHSLRPVRCNFVAIDPMFRIGDGETFGQGERHFMEMTSADFFASGFCADRGLRFDMAFLDGLHLFEALLVDFIATEALMNRDGVIALHDCLPFAPGMTGRTWDQDQTRFWAGDLWKVVAILQTHRPDLNLTALDAWPTGLVLVEGLDPTSGVLAEKRDELVAAWMTKTLPDYGLAKYFGAFDIESTWRRLAAG